MDASKPTNGTRSHQGSGVVTGIQKLARALDALDEAVELRLAREASLGDAEAEVQRMGADRSRLADALDNAAARSQRLESTNKEVSRRLVDAMEAIRSVLDGPGEQQP